jgi:hypothetical protein
MVMANAGIVGVCFVERKVVAFYWELHRFLEEFGNVVAFHNNLFFYSNPQPVYVLFPLSFAIFEDRFPILFVHVETAVDNECSMLWMVGKY